MSLTRWTAFLLTLLLLGGTAGCGDDEPEEGTTIIRETQDEGDADIEIKSDDEGLRMDVEVDEEGNVSGEVEVKEDPD